MYEIQQIKVLSINGEVAGGDDVQQSHRAVLHNSGQMESQRESELSFELRHFYGDGDTDMRLTISTPTGDLTCDVQEQDFAEAWAMMRKLNGKLAVPGHTALTEDDREQVAAAVEQAAALLEAEGRHDVATGMRSKVLWLMGRADQPVVPMQAIDPGEFDRRIEQARADLTYAQSTDEHAGIQVRLRTLQELRTAMLGAELPDPEGGPENS